MGKTKCPRCGFNYTVFNMNTKPWRCKCGAMLKGNVGWRKLRNAPRLNWTPE